MLFQLGSALLDACVLSVLSRQDAYGYVLTQNIRAAVDISESTLYPVLRRLQSDGCLTTYDQPYQGRNRRYYAITPQGRHRCQEMLEAWEQYKRDIDQILLGGLEDHDER